MRKLICTLASALLLTAFITGCATKDGNDYSTLWGLMGSKTTPEQQIALDDYKAQVKTMNLSQLQNESDKEKALISDKTAELDQYKKQLSDIPITDITSDKAASLKDKISNATTNLSDLNKRLSIVLDQINAVK